jgi:hypothetical protein
MMHQGIGFYDNPYKKEEIFERLGGYNPAGMKVSFGIRGYSGAGTVTEGIGGGIGGFFWIDIDREYKTSFERYAEIVGLEGGKKWDSVYLFMKERGCIGEDDTINCIYAAWNQIKLIGFKKGLPVEYVEGDPYATGLSGIRSTPGIVNDVYKLKGDDGIENIVEMFMLEPMSPTQAPKAIEEGAIKPEHLSKYTDRLSYKTYQKWLAKDPGSLPPGMLQDTEKHGRTEYLMEEPIELERVKEFCLKYVKDEKARQLCWLTSALFHILPINAKKGSGTFRPMRMTVAAMYRTEEVGRIGQLKEAGILKLPMMHTMTEEDIELRIKWIKYKRKQEQAGREAIPYDDWEAQGEPEA